MAAHKLHADLNQSRQCRSYLSDTLGQHECITWIDAWQCSAENPGARTHRTFDFASDDMQFSV
jgi:hypothetical protein